MDATEAQAADGLLRWLFRRAGPDGVPVSDERFREAGLLLSRLARRALPASLGPEQVALPLRTSGGKPPVGVAVYRNRRP